MTGMTRFLGGVFDREQVSRLGSTGFFMVLIEILMRSLLGRLLDQRVQTLGTLSELVLVDRELLRQTVVREELIQLDLRAAAVEAQRGQQAVHLEVR